MSEGAGRRCVLCGSGRAISAIQRICLDCLAKTYVPSPRPFVELVLVEDHGDVKVYEPREQALARKRTPGGGLNDGR